MIVLGRRGPRKGGRGMADRKLNVALGISETIRELGSVVSGTMYALLCAEVTLGEYEAIIGALKGAGLVSEKNYVLTWIGPNGPK